MSNIEIITVTKQNIDSYSPRCFLRPDNPGQIQKNKWVLDRFSEGMTIKLLYIDKKFAGYIEYIPGKHAWRAVDAANYLFIHCIWMYPNKHKDKGYGSLLINESIKEAKDLDLCGVSVVTSDESFMASKDIFEKNGFIIVQEDSPYQLLVKNHKECAPPAFNDYKDELSKYKGLHIVYSQQCPWVNRFMDETKDEINKLGITVTELKTSEEAQHAPSIYTSFSFINDGTLLVDHYISKRRFDTIIKKVLK
jgi:hypothetical protein